MSIPEPYLPPEILDSILDLLHDQPETLKECCLVSKSWVPRTRMHLFADIQFESPADLEAWKTIFPDPANSPAHHTRSLFVGCPEAVTIVDAEEGGWIRAFSNVRRFEVWRRVSASREPMGSFVPFHNFSSALKSLRVVSRFISLSEVLNLICSLPFLEDLDIMSGDVDVDGGDEIIFRPPTSPLLTGTLALDLISGTEIIVRQLLELPNGLHFRNFVCTPSHGKDLEWVTALMDRCRDTLEYAYVECFIFGNLPGVSVDFSKATKLKKVTFQFYRGYVAWVTMALKTITSAHRDLREISIHIPVGARDALREEICRQWTELDRTLVQLWESRAIRVTGVYDVERGEWEAVCEYIQGLLPEMTRRGGIEMVNCIESDSTQ